MLDAVKRYATRILLIHLALFVLVISFVAGAARDVQLTAREQAQLQTQDRLELLAQQTARGLQSHYSAILADLDILLRDDTAAATQASRGGAASTQPSRAGRGQRYLQNGGGRGRGGRGFGNQPPVYSGPVNANQSTLNVLWRQLQSRGVSQLFLVYLGPEIPDVEQTRAIYSFPDNKKDDARQLANEHLEWLRTIDEATMSSLALSEPDANNDRQAYHLLAIPARLFGFEPPPEGDAASATRPGAERPGVVAGELQNRGFNTNGGGPFGGGFNPRGGRGRGGIFDGGRGGFDGPGAGFGGRGGPGGPGGRGGMEAPDDQGPPPGGPVAATQPKPLFAVVAVVQVDTVKDQFLEHLNDEQKHHDANAILLNDTGEILVASNLNSVGTNLLTQLPEEIRAKVEPLLLRDGANPIVIEKPFTIGDTAIPPQIVSAARFEMPSGRHWTVLISSSVAEAETIVDSVLHSALVWVTFFSLAVTALLVSTSAFLIRSRVRFERMRHDVLTRELEQARHIQLAWLPDIKTAPKGLDVSAANLPASHISGDFYNWFPLPRTIPASGRNAPQGSADHDPNAKIAIVIGDVTGHGMAAAFLMATTQLLVRMTLTRWHDPARCLRDVNQQLCTQGFKGQFVTMLVMILDPLDNTMEVATAGHPAPLLARNGGSFESLDLQPQLVLGVDPGEDYRSQSFVLEPGASLLLYTDGVIEAETSEGEQFGTDRLIEALSTNGVADPAARIKAVLQAVERFRGTRDLLDDLTLVALRTAASPVPSLVH
jgi:serine phosphatase RsbU (regulator of sigma subunit)